MFVGAALKAPTSLNWPLIEVPLKIHFIFPQLTQLVISRWRNIPSPRWTLNGNCIFITQTDDEMFINGPNTQGHRIIAMTIDCQMQLNWFCLLRWP